MKELQNVLKDRENKEVEDITKILEELRKAISKELEKTGKPEQMDLFNDEEKEQFRQDINALRHRLQEIPEEIEREVEHIKKRFMNTQARIFPVALTFLVPDDQII